jgi:hypothetical protein
MLPAYARAYATLVDRLADPALADRVAAVRSAFVRRAGAWSADDAWFEAHAAAFADRALCDDDVRAAVATIEGDDVATIARSLAWSERGLFSIDRHGSGASTRIELTCVICGGAFRLAAGDDGGGVHFLDAASVHVESFVDARVVPPPSGVMVLPGIVAHAADAGPSIRALLRDDVGRDANHERLLDALLFLRHELAARSRMRAPQVYRVDALRAALSR